MKPLKSIHLLRRLIALGIISVVVASVFLVQRSVHGQTSDVLPWIVSTTPARGDELPVDGRVTFTFNTAMNHNSVESAFSVTPAAPGAFQWQGDTAFTFTPAKAFDRETAYIFTIDSHATSKAGTPLRDTFSLKLHTTGYLTVTQFFPAADANGVDLEPTITLVFNRPVVPLGTAAQMQAMASPFRSYPAIVGSGEWLTTSIYSFKASKALAGDTIYTLTIPKGLKDVSGSVVKTDISWHFRTLNETPYVPEPFNIHYLAPQNGIRGIYRHPLIQIGFNYPVDMDSAKAGFSLSGPDGKPIPGKFTWKEDQNELDFSPSVILDYSTQYNVKVDPKKVFDTKHEPLILGWNSAFTTLDLPTLDDTTPHDGELVNTSASVFLYFSNPMKLDNIASRIEIAPKVPGVVLDTEIAQDSRSAHIQFGTLPSTTYTITVNTKDLVDIWGTQIQLNPKSKAYRIVGPDRIQFRYVTGGLGAAVSLETAGQAMGLYNAYHQTRIFVTHRNIGTIGMALFSDPLMVFLNPTTKNAYNPNPNPDNQESLVRRWVVPVYNPQNVMRYDLLSITTDGTSIGQQGNVVCIEAAPSILAIGQRVRVVRKEIPKDENATPTVPAPVNIRNAPGTQNTVVIGQATSGTDFDVLDGPVCGDQYVWWKVQSSDGNLNGWIPEGDLKQPYVVPLIDNATPAATATAAATAAATATASPTATRTPTAIAGPTPFQPMPFTGLFPTPADSPVVPQGLAPGIYRLEMEAPEIQGNGQNLNHVMLIATDNITLKVAQHSALAWVTNLKTGKPSVGLPVQFYRLMQVNNQRLVMPYGKAVITDSNGIAEFNPGEELYPVQDLLYAAVTGPGHFGITASTWTEGIDITDFQQPSMFNSQDMALYLYTDRRLYRRGDKIYFKGTLRNRNEAVYSMTDKKVVPVEIIDPYNQTVYSKDLPVNEFGSFSDSFTLDTDAMLGEYRVIARPNKPKPPQTTGTSTPQPSPTPLFPRSVNPPSTAEDPQFTTEVTVADYTPPEFQVSVNPTSAHVTPPDMVKATVNASYFFGGPVANSGVQWDVQTDPYSFYYTGSGNYSFDDYNQDQISQDYADDQSQYVSSGQGTTDDKGQYAIAIPASLGKSGRSLVYTIQATVSDGYTLVSERNQVVVDQGLFHVGVGTDSYVGATNEKQTAHVIAVDNNSSPLSNISVDVRVSWRIWASVQTVEPGTGRTVWQNDLKEVDEAAGKVTTDTNGKATFDFTPIHGGAYKVYATAKDSRGNEIKASSFIWISGRSFTAWREPNSNRIDLQADKASYKVGDTASILIPTPFQDDSTALITIERGSILKKEVITLHGNSTIYKLPITPDMAPDAFVSVTVIKGEDAHNFTAAFRIGLLQLTVDTAQLGLNISVKSDKQKAGPREQVTFKLHVTNYAGEPVRAEVGLALVDDAILSLLPDDLPSLMAYFYSRQGLGVRTANALIYNIDANTQEIINIRKGGGKGGSDYFGIYTVRHNYVGTPLWEPFVVTDGNGDASVTVTLPDQLTTWVLDARAFTLPMGDTHTTLVGQTTQTIISTKPLLIRPEVPRFYVVGDKSTLTAVVNNNTDKDQEVAVTVDLKGAAVSGDLIHYATIPANNQKAFDWPISVLDSQAVDATFKVTTKDGKYTDAAKPATGQGDARLLPVLRYETPDTVTTSGVIGNQGGIRTEGLLVSSATKAATSAPTQDNLQIHVDRSLASSSTAALHALQIYPYYCIEQTVSRFLPDAVTYRAERSLGVTDKAHYDELSAILQTALQRIYNDQHSDGGWGWFIDDQSDQLISAYTVLGMAEAKAAGWQIDDKVYANAIEALKRGLKDVDDKTPWWDLNRQAFILYVLARASQQQVQLNEHQDFYDVSRSVKLFDQRDRMNLDAQALLALDFSIITPSSGFHTKPLMDSIKKAAKFSLTGVHWEESDYDTWNWTTNTRSTAIVLKALIETEPSSPLIPDAVRWLMNARKFDSWETTQETAWSVMALTDWVLKTGDLTPNYRFNITINGQNMSSGEKASAANARVGYDLQVSVAQLLQNQVNQVAIQRNQGDGTLYYSAQLKTYQPVEQVKALSRGIVLQRAYSLENDPLHRPITTANVGDEIRVTLTIIVPETLNYVAIEDPIPAGTQSIDLHLQTSARENLDDPLQYGWEYWAFTHIELRDEKTVLYAPYLPQGTYQYIYQLRAGVPGVYHVMPANGHEFYMPEVFGRSDGQLFTLLPAGQQIF